MATEARKMRRDAELNRERILDAARGAFAEHGLDVGVDEIARRAGVGMGTLYRHFPSKDALIDAIFESSFDTVAQAARDALEAEDAWEGLVQFLSRTVELQVANRGLSEVLASRHEAEHLVARKRARLQKLVRALITRAQEEGALRPDFVPNDMRLLLSATGRVVEMTADSAPNQWRRFLGMLLDGLRARPTL